MAASHAQSGTRAYGCLVVCHANLCRSPLAHGIVVSLLRARGLDHRCRVESAGVCATPGLAPHRLSVEVARQHGIELEAICGVSRCTHPDDLYRFDQILAVDRSVFAELRALRRQSAFGEPEPPRAEIRYLRALGHTGAESRELDVADPIGRGLEAYQALYADLEPCCRAFVDEFEERYATRGSGEPA